MAQGYTRQSTFSDGDTITASLFNNEYNQLLNSFSYSASNASTTGHRHDGTAGQGGNIFKIGDLDFLNKIEVDSTNNRWGFYVEVSSAAVEQIRVQDGAIVPVTDNDIDLGTSSLEFKDLFLDGTAHVDTLDVDTNATVAGTLGVTGVTTLSDNLSVGGNLTVTGNATIAGNLTFGDAATDTVAFSADVASNLLPSVDNTYDLGASGSEWKDLYIDGTANIDSLVADTADINGGTIDAANITVGSGKTLDVSAGTLTLADNQISGNKVEGGTIAATTITDLTFGSLDDGTINITAFVDEDNMASNSATLVPTQQSVKAYVDSQVTAQDLDVTTDSGTIAIDLDSETLTVSGGTGLDSSATGNAITVAIDSTVATLTGSQTLTNKTLTAPVISGNLTTDGLLDGRDVAADGTKLDGVEASADVTDTTNVTAAGALMDSEVTNLAQVKAFASSDYATAAQGTKADAALPKAGGAMTGAITTNSTFDGRDVATDGTKLDGIEASADVTDTANVTAAGALMDSELTAIASVKALNQGVATSNSPSFTNLTLSGTGSVKVPAGTTAQRDGSPAAGMFRYNSSLAQFEGYTDAWGAIGGGGGTNTFTADSFTGNGSTTAYALSQVTSSEDNLLVFIEGVFQQQDAYSIATSSGTTTLTFSAAPANTRKILIYSVASAVSGSNLNIDSMTGDGSDTTLTLSIAPVNENNTQVFIDGVYQSKANYSISGTTLTFSTAPPTGTAVEVMTFTQTDINVPVDGTITSAKLSGALTTPSTLVATGKITADAGIDIDNINIDGTTIALSSGDLTLDAAGKIILDGDEAGATVHLKDGGVHWGSIYRSSSNFNIKSETQDKDIVFLGNDGGSAITALTLDMSAAGFATFNNGIKANRDISAYGANTGSSANRMALSMEGSGVSRLICNGADGSTNGTFEVFTANSGGTGSVKLSVDASGNVEMRGGENVRISLGTAGGSGANNTSNWIRGNAGYLQYNSASSGHTWEIGGTERMRIDASGAITMPAVYNDTTAAAANMHISSAGGLLFRSTSSARYKNTITDATHGLTELLTLRPVTYKGNNDGDTVFGGLIAEEVHDAGLTEFVQYNDEDEPDALAYGNMVSLCIKAIQELKEELNTATARITELENN